MCGINGLMQLSGASLPDPRGLVERMNAAIAHRGPDDSGFWSSPAAPFYCGHQRLSILDLSPAGHQPMLSSEGTAIVYNGEVYNYNQLKGELKNRAFFSGTDTEVLLYLYEEEGPLFLQRLNGMFAMGLWDEGRERLLLARDRIGIKPLYYTEQNGVFAFSSEIKALLTLPWVRAELDEEALYHFLTFSKVMPPRTMFRNIFKVRPAHYLLIGRGGIEEYAPYWEVEYTDYAEWGEGALEERLLEELRQSVAYRMISDVPVGAFLSGGVDSSAVVALMSERTEQRVKTYSIGFQDAPGYDELAYSRSIAERYGAEHIERVVTPEDIRTFLPHVVDVYDEPLADATSIPIYFLSQLARENGTIVVLTGDGADEIFGGYRSWMRYAKWYPYYRWYARTPAPLRQFVRATYGAVSTNSPFYEILDRASRGEEFFWGAKGFKGATKTNVVSSAYRQRIDGVDSHQEMVYFRDRFDSINKNARSTDDLDWMCYLGIKNIVPDYYLYRADRLGMAHSIELRVPFLDHNMVNFALSVPASVKISNGEPKRILKRALEPILPKETLYRRKQGFCVPLQEWAGDIMIGYLEDNLTAFCRDTGLFDEKEMREQLQRFKQGRGDSATSIWNVYFLISWFKKWIL